MALDTTDTLAAIIILLCGLIGVLFPFLPYAKERPEIQRAGEAHSAGLFLALALCHMLDDANDSWDNYKDAHDIDDDYPYPELIAGLAFILLLSLDLLQARIMSSWEDGEYAVGIPPWLGILLGVTFAIISPVALLVAAALDAGASDLAVTLIQGAAAGTFLFLTSESLGALKDGHGHDHAMDTSSVGKALFCFAFLSAHSVLDGLVVATGGDNDVDTWALCVAIAFHKLWAAMALGFKLQNAGRIRKHGQALLQAAADGEVKADGDAGVMEGDHEDERHRHHQGGCKSIFDYIAFLLGFGVLAAVAAAT
eukprot:CAMPEP_0170186368 /NCGR_PEP_ID=MMETSP0040_2-20121228/38938_1 /TAXON_ID=641309 /ORGANISM="Lotharella oceanica, Strain CCMP622" /LENGTH=309 /DNA_ID=CAMNT_0010433085 /DNA_START=20 /DNA_END=949 /DNA_ORIENTATION=+